MIPPKLFIATPAFNGLLQVPYAISLAQTCTLLSHKGVTTNMCITGAGSLLVCERNQLNDAFLQSPCTHMLCIDADMGWQAEDVVKMLAYDEPFVAAAYLARKDHIFHYEPVQNPDLSIVVKGDLIKVNYIPAGFMLIKREVIEKIHAHFPELHYKAKACRGRKFEGVAIFNTELIDGEFWGEDFVFCQRARQAGIELWVDPYVELNHDGKKGKLIDVFSNTPPASSQIGSEGT